MVSLVITIIILLILSSVIIGVLEHKNIINLSKEATNKYNEEQSREIQLIENHEFIQNENNKNDYGISLLDNVYNQNNCEENTYVSGANIISYNGWKSSEYINVEEDSWYLL